MYADQSSTKAVRRGGATFPTLREADKRPLIPDPWKLIWSELPLMMVISLLVTLASAVIAVLVVTVAVAAPLVSAVLIGPLWLGAVAICAHMLAGDAVGIRDLGAAIRHHARTGIELAMLPAIVATLLIGSVGILTANDDQRWLLLPIAVDAIALVVLVLGCITVFPLAAMTDLRGRARWLAALALAGRNLAAILGIAALVILLALSIRSVGPILILIAGGPLALLCAATTRRATDGAAL